MKKSPFLLLTLLLLLMTSCSESSRAAIGRWIRESGGPAAVEGAQVAMTAAVEAAQTNVPIARTAAAVAAATGGPIARTLVAEGVPVAGTVSAEVLATGGPLAGTAAAAGLGALGTRTAQQPGYRCPADVYTVDSDLNQVVDISGEQLDAAIAATVPGSPLIGLGALSSMPGRFRASTPTTLPPTPRGIPPGGRMPWRPARITSSAMA